MSSTLRVKDTIAIDEELQASATAVVKARGDARVNGLQLTTTAGDSIHLDNKLAELVAKIISRVAQGGSLTFMTMPEVLTTSTAAEVLGVSRPTLMKFIKSGRLPSTKVGTHHRVLHADVITLREAREQDRQQAVKQLLELGD